MKGSRTLRSCGAYQDARYRARGGTTAIEVSERDCRGGFRDCPLQRNLDPARQHHVHGHFGAGALGGGAGRYCSRGRRGALPTDAPTLASQVRM